MAQGKRYKFIGSSFQVQTGFGSPKTITAISQASPPVVTSAAHGQVLGSVVSLNNIPGMTELEDQLFAVDDPLTNTFELAGADSSDYDAFSANSPNTAQALPVTFSRFCELTSFQQQDGQADEYDATTICSTAKEFEIGLGDSGSLSLDFNWAGNQPVQAALRAAKVSGELIAFKLVFPKDGGTVIMFGLVQQTSFQGSVGDGIYRASATIKLSGDIVVQAAA